MGPDAHSVKELGNAAYAVGIARKGWVTPSATLNAKSARELAAWLRQRKRPSGGVRRRRGGSPGFPGSNSRGYL